jgi:hypothetical protein
MINQKGLDNDVLVEPFLIWLLPSIVLTISVTIGLTAILPCLEFHFVA